MFNSLFGGRKKREELKATLIQEATGWMNGVNQSKGFVPIATNVLLQPGEKAFWEVQKSELSETRAVRYGSGGGVGIRVAKGVYLGGGNSTSESKQEWRTLDVGILTITNKRLLFAGAKESRTVKLSDIVSINNNLDSLEITTSTRSKSISLSVANPYICAALIRIIVQVPDPEHLEQILDIQFR